MYVARRPSRPKAEAASHRGVPVKSRKIEAGVEFPWADRSTPSGNRGAERGYDLSRRPG